MEDRNLHFSASPALVVSVNWGNGLSLIRDLGREGIPVIALDPRADAIGLTSKYALGIVCPDPGDEADRFVQFMLGLGQHLSHRAVVFLTRDQDIVTVSHNREALEQYYHLPFANCDVVQKIVDKRGQCLTAQRIGIPMPITHFPGGESEVEQLANHLPYPVIVKPTYHVEFGKRFKSKGFIANNPTEVLAQFRRASTYEVMIQEVIPGGADHLYTLGSYLNREGEALGLFTGRKLRQVPRDFGVARAAESAEAPVVVEQGLRLLRALGFWGISQVEFKLDPRDGQYKLIEVNARSYLWQSLATACGANLAHIAYCDALGQPPTPAQSHGEGRCWVMLPVDLAMTPGEILRGHYSLGAWLSSLRRIAATAIFAWDDLQPGWRYLRQRLGRARDERG